MAYTAKTRRLSKASIQPASARFSAAVIPADVLINIARVGLWLIAGGLFLLSLVGNYVQFLPGGWASFWNAGEAAQRALFYAFAWQVVCSVAQFAFLKTRVWWAYFSFLGASVVPSGLSYFPVMVPAITAWLAANGLGSALASIMAVFVVGGVILFADFLQERILVQR